MSMKDLARDPRQVGNLVRRARKKQGLSQSQLGDKAGLRQETISLIETGHPAAKLQTILGFWRRSISSFGLCHGRRGRLRTSRRSSDVPPPRPCAIARAAK